ncbi:hypothetical protein AA313_de0208271 [Arthrobotrys entomopaga]|nr:hypothetical protein AA313_de0208271 [Arthrobotrys entomopaga]
MEIKNLMSKPSQIVSKPVGVTNGTSSVVYPSASALKRIKWWKKRLLSSTPNQKLDLIRKSMWAIGDRDKFERLVRDIRDLVESLYKILPVTETERDAIAIQDIKSLSGDLTKLTLFEEASSSNHPAWSSAASIITEVSSSEKGPRTIVSQWISGLQENDPDESITDELPETIVPNPAKSTVFPGII